MQPGDLAEAKRAALAKHLENVSLGCVQPVVLMDPLKGLQDENTVINVQAWSDYVKKKNPAEVKGLVTISKSGNWSKLLPACLRLFSQYEQTIKQSNTKVCKQWIDAGKGPDSQYLIQFNPLQSDRAIRSYMSLLCGLVHLALWTEKLIDSKAKEKLVLYLTPEVEHHADQLLKVLKAAQQSNLSPTVFINWPWHALLQKPQA
ncbi:hypothetical protein FRC09_003874 [Ceratobasidium sp. 395]|nr:hypothetical protein FRC09_003874 [Ceratobasidium sp. 395]